MENNIRPLLFCLFTDKLNKSLFLHILFVNDFPCICLTFYLIAALIQDQVASLSFWCQKAIELYQLFFVYIVKYGFSCRCDCNDITDTKFSDFEFVGIQAFHVFTNFRRNQTCDDGFDYTLYNKDFTERDGGILETDGDKSVQEAMTELLAEFGCDAAEGKVMDAAELREQVDAVAEQQAEVLKEKLAAERPAPEETLSFYVAECLEFTFAGEFHDHLTMEEALEVYDKIPSERMNANKCIGFCIEENGGFVGMYELVVDDKVQRENINSINYFRDDKLVQQAISDMEKLMAARQQSKEQERSNTKKSVLDALRSLKAKKQDQPAQEQDKPKKAKKKGMEL